MDFEDLLEPEVAAAAALTAVVASPQVRNALRRGAVYGLAGLLVAGDAISTFSKGVGRGMQRVAAPAATNGTNGRNGANGASATHASGNTSEEESAGVDNGS